MELDDTDTLVSSTLSVFGELPFDVLDQSWIDSAWNNRYTDVNLPDVDLLESCEGNCHALLDALSSACDVCQKWSLYSAPEDVAEENADEKLWQTLMENGVHYKALLGLVYVGISQGNMPGATFVNKRIALRFCKLYFNLVLVPGSTAYRIFQESLFQSSVQCFRLPSRKNSLSGGDSTAGSRGSSQNASGRGAGRGAGRGGRRKQNATAPVHENGDVDGESAIGESETMPESMLLDFMTCITDTLKDLVWMLQKFSLRSYGDVTDFLVQHLCELTQLDIPGADLRFNANLEQQFGGCNYRQLTTYAYCALKLLCLPLHGEPAENFRTVAKSLMPHILMLAAGNAQSVSRPFTNIRDNAVSFLCHVLQACEESLKESFEDVIIILIHNIAFCAVDRTDFRLKTAQAVLILMGGLGEERFKRVVQWFIRLTMVSLANQRVFALEMILTLIWDERVANKRSELLLAAMERCNDKAATVKTKALSVLACVTNEEPEQWAPLLKVSNPVEPDGEGEGEQVAVEDDRLSQLMQVLKYRTEDSKVNVRKAALSLLQNVLCASGDFIKKEYIEELIQASVSASLDTQLHRLFSSHLNSQKKPSGALGLILKESCLDLALLVRKQALHSLTRCLRMHPQEELLQRFWLEGALPLVLDAENSVMEKAVEAVEELILGPLCLLSPGHEAELAWQLLAQVSQGPYREYDKYLQQAILHLHHAQKIRSNQLNSLKTHVGGANDASVWLLLSKLSLCCDLGQGNFAFSYWNQHWEERPEGSNVPRASNETINHVLIVLKKVSRHLSSNALRGLIADMEQRLSQLSLPIDVIPHTVECLHCLKRTLHRERPELGERIVEVWCKQMLDKCQTFLSEAVAGAMGEDSILQEEQLVRHLVLLGEAAQPAPRAVSSELHQLVQACMTSLDKTELTEPTEPLSVEDAAVSELDAEREEVKDKKPPKQTRGRLAGPRMSCLRVSRRVRAHAVVAMGMLCIQNERLVKTVVPTMGRALASAQDPMMRANLIVALTDMCKRYAVLVDPYLPVITRCIKDPVTAVRSLVLTCLLQLLQQDFVRLHGRLFYRLLSALTDEQREVRKLAEFGLVDCLLKRNSHIFYQRFVECICYFNCYANGSGSQASQENIVETSKRDKRLFGLEGVEQRERRMALYRFLLLNMPYEDRFKLTLALTQSVLMACADEMAIGPTMEEQCPEMLHDALWVLCSDEIKLQTITAAAEDAVTEEDPTQAVMHTTRKTILSTVVRVNLVENVIPVVISLKNKLEAVRSPLVRSVLMFLRELMRDYKAEVKDILAADKKLASEVAYDLRRLEQEEEGEAAADGQPQGAPKTPARMPNPELRELLVSARKLREEAIKRRSIVMLPEVAPEEGNEERRGEGTAANQEEGATTTSSEENPGETAAPDTTPGRLSVDSNKSASSRTSSKASKNSVTPLPSSTGYKGTPARRSKGRRASLTARKELSMNNIDNGTEEQMQVEAPTADEVLDRPPSRCSIASDLSNSTVASEDNGSGGKKRGRAKKGPLSTASPGSSLVKRQRSPQRRMSDCGEGEFKKPVKAAQQSRKAGRSTGSPSSAQTSTPVLGDRRKRLRVSPDISVIK